MNEAHRPSQRTHLLDAALELIRSGGTVSLDSAAKAAGVTKPGLMYHFPTKESLVAGMVDRLLDTYDAELESLVPADADAESPQVRLRAYIYI